jgi:hypothetical protein
MRYASCAREALRSAAFLKNEQMNQDKNRKESTGGDSSEQVWHPVSGVLFISRALPEVFATLRRSGYFLATLQVAVKEQHTDKSYRLKVLVVSRVFASLREKIGFPLFWSLSPGLRATQSGKRGAARRRAVGERLKSKG